MNFNTSYVTVQRHFCAEIIVHFLISIHPMLRFNLFNFRRRFFICNFNTSYVTVQPKVFFLVRFAHCISIHPMLRFNRNSHFTKVFLISISIHPMLRFNNYLWRILNVLVDFNTSYVTVQQTKTNVN